MITFLLIILGIFVFIAICAFIIESLLGTAENIVVAGSEVVKTVWADTNMTYHIDNGVNNVCFAIGAIYKGFKNILTKDNIDNWLNSHNYSPDDIIIVEKENVSTTAVIVKCKIFDNNGELLEEVYWECHSTEYQLERYIGRHKVKDLV